MPGWVNGVAYDLSIPEENREYHRQYQKRYNAANKDKLNGYMRKYMKERKATDPEFKERLRELGREHYYRYIEKYREKNATYTWTKYNFDDDYRLAALAKAKERYETDEKYREDRKKRYKDRYENDAEFREKQRAYSRDYRAAGNLPPASYFGVKFN